MKIVIFYFQFFTLAAAGVCSLGMDSSYTGMKLVQTAKFSVAKFTRTDLVLLCQCINGKLVRSQDFELTSQSSVFQTILCFEGINPASHDLTNSVKAAKSSLKSILKLDLANLEKLQLASADHRECYKVARRRIYARLNLRFFMPHTFTGGLYKCIPSRSTGTCQREDFTSVGPLVAEDPRKRWYTVERNPLRLFHHNLFLRTASSWEFNMVYNKLIGGQWESQVDAEENYNYSRKDMDAIGKALAATSSLANKAAFLIAGESKTPTKQKTLDSANSILEQLHSLELVHKMQLIWDELRI